MDKIESVIKPMTKVVVRDKDHLELIFKEMSKFYSDVDTHKDLVRGYLASYEQLVIGFRLTYDENWFVYNQNGSCFHDYTSYTEIYIEEKPMNKVVLRKFDGTLGEFLEEFSQGVPFYQTDADHKCQIKIDSIALLTNYYSQGVYKEVDMIWEEHVKQGGKVLCKVWNIADNEQDKTVQLVYSIDSENDYKTCQSYYEYAIPLTKEEALQYVWEAN